VEIFRSKKLAQSLVNEETKVLVAARQRERQGPIGEQAIEDRQIACRRTARGSIEEDRSVGKEDIGAAVNRLTKPPLKAR
jgi:hypothetical protein